MQENEYKKLLEKYGESKTKRMIEVLDNYKGSKGRQYKNDYRAILSWVVERVNEETARRSVYGFNTDKKDFKQQSTSGEFKPSEGFGY